MISDDSWSGNRWYQQVIVYNTCLRYNYTLRPFFDSTARQRRSQFKNWGMWNRIGWVVFLDYLMGTWHLLWKVKAGYVQCRRTSPLARLVSGLRPSRWGPSGWTTLHTNWPNCLHYFLLSENVWNYKIGTTMFHVACRTLLVMFCVLKFYFVDFYGMFTSSPTWQFWHVWKCMCFAKLGKILFFKTKHC